MDIDKAIASDAWLQAMESLYGREYVEQLLRSVDEGKRKDGDDEASSE
jgi:hypothetical protein